MAEKQPAVKQDVQAFYDRIGWKLEEEVGQGC